MQSKAVRSRITESCPKPDTLTVMHRGLSSARASRPKPIASITPGRKFSSRMSASRTSSVSCARPSSERTSIVTPRLFRFICAK